MLQLKMELYGNLNLVVILKNQQEFYLNPKLMLSQEDWFFIQIIVNLVIMPILDIKHRIIMKECISI